MHVTLSLYLYTYRVSQTSPPPLFFSNLDLRKISEYTYFVIFALVSYEPVKTGFGSSETGFPVRNSNFFYETTPIVAHQSKALIREFNAV